jgi:hypothetical protein
LKFCPLPVLMCLSRLGRKHQFQDSEYLSLHVPFPIMNSDIVNMEKKDK